MNSTRFNEAMRYAEHGLSVIPLAPKAKVPPRGFGWSQFQHRRADEHELRDIFDMRDDLNIGIVCGDVSNNLMVRDFDDLNAYREWARQNPKLQKRLPTVQTSRGYQVYARYPEDGMRSQAFEDGELRVNGEYTVAPSSTHPSGWIYEWLRPIGRKLPTVDPVLLTSPCTARKAAGTQTTNDMCVPSLPIMTVQQAIEATQPTKIGERNRCLFALARYLKALIPDADAGQLNEIVRDWHRLALPMIGTKAFDATWHDFIRAWQSVKHAAGRPLWNQALGIAEQIELPRWAQRYDAEGYRRLVRLVIALHQVHGGAPFPLACRVVAKHVGNSHKMAARMLKTLVFDRVLIVVSTKAMSGHSAYEYQYIGHQKEVQVSPVAAALAERMKPRPCPAAPTTAR